jgi:hypothetical protein
MESMGRAQSLVRDLIIQCEWIFENHEAEEEVEEENKERHGEEEVVVEKEVSMTGDVEELPAT